MLSLSICIAPGGQYRNHSWLFGCSPVYQYLKDSCHAWNYDQHTAQPWCKMAYLLLCAGVYAWKHRWCVKLCTFHTLWSPFAWFRVWKRTSFSTKSHISQVCLQLLVLIAAIWFRVSASFFVDGVQKFPCRQYKFAFNHAFYGLIIVQTNTPVSVFVLFLGWSFFLGCCCL